MPIYFSVLLSHHPRRRRRRRHFTVTVMLMVMAGIMDDTSIPLLILILYTLHFFFYCSYIRIYTNIAVQSLILFASSPCYKSLRRRYLTLIIFKCTPFFPPRIYFSIQGIGYS